MGVVETDGKRYVTYLHKGEEFNVEDIFTNLSNKYSYKPDCAWWGSPEECGYSWKDYVTFEYGKSDYDFDKPIKWHLEEGSKIYQIDHKDVQPVMENEFLKYIYYADYSGNRIPMPMNEMVLALKDVVNFEKSPKIDYYKLLDDGIVAVELMDSCIGHLFFNGLETMFNSWDCESIVVLDSSKIIFDQEE